MAKLLRKVEKHLYGDNQWAGTWYYKAANGSAEAESAGMLGVELMTASTSQFYVPVCTAANVVLGQFHGYDTSGQPGALLIRKFTSLRRVNKAMVKGRGGSIATKALYDLDDKHIEGPAPDGLNSYRAVPAGSNVVAKSSELLVVQACYAAMPAATARGWKGKVNSNTFTSLGCATGTLLLWDYTWWPVYAGPNTRWYADYYFRVSPYLSAAGALLPWNSGCKAEVVAHPLVQVPVLTGALAATGLTRVRRHAVPGKILAAAGTLTTQALSGRRLFLEANMSGLSNIIGT